MVDTQKFHKWQEDFHTDMPNFKDTNLVWLGASSFEKRCLGSLQERLPSFLKAALVLEYHTRLYPKEKGEKLRAEHHRKMLEFIKHQEHEILIKNYAVNPYSPRSLRVAMESFEHNLREKLNLAVYDLVVDISCLTKIHTVYAILWCLRNVQISNLWIAYSLPEDYESPRALRRSNPFGWNSVASHPLIVSKLGSLGQPKSEFSYGIFLAGHEGDRTRAARNGKVIDVIDLVIALTPDDIWLEDKARSEHEDLMREISRKGKLGWKLSEWPKLDALGFGDQILTRLENFRRKKKEESLRLYFVPLGPKSLILGAIVAFSKVKEIDVNVLYPVPAGYDTNYTVGLKRTYWIMIK